MHSLTLIVSLVWCASGDDATAHLPAPPPEATVPADKVPPSLPGGGETAPAAPVPATTAAPAAPAPAAAEPPRPTGVSEPSRSEAAPAAAQSEPHEDVPALSKWNEAELTRVPYTGYLLQALVREGGRASDQFRARLFALVIGLGNAIGRQEEPSQALALALRRFTHEFGFRIAPEPCTLDAVMPDRILETKCGTPIVLTTVLLALLDRQTFGTETKARFPLQPLLLPGMLALRYEHENYHFNVVLTEGGLVLSDRELLERFPVAQKEREQGVYFRKLSPTELAGTLLGELARAHAAAGNDALQERYMKSAIAFFPESIDLRLQLARVLLRNGQRADALPHIDVALRKSPERGETHFLRGLACFAAEEHALAKASFHSALECGYSEQGKLWLYLARVAALEGSLPDLRRYLREFQEKSGRKDLAAEIEGVMDHLTVAQAIKTMASEAPYDAKFAAADALAAKPTPEGNEALIRALGDPNLRFRTFAWKTLCGIARKDLPLNQEEWWRWHAAGTRERGAALWGLLDVTPRKPETR